MMHFRLSIAHVTELPMMHFRLSVAPFSQHTPHSLPLFSKQFVTTSLKPRLSLIFLLRQVCLEWQELKEGRAGGSVESDDDSLLQPLWAVPYSRVLLAHSPEGPHLNPGSVSLKAHT